MTSVNPVGTEVEVRVALRPKRETIHGYYIYLEPLDIAHTDDLYDIVCGEQHAPLWDYMADGPFLDITTFRAHIARISQLEDPVFYAVVRRDLSRAVGYASLMRIDLANRVIEVGNIMFSPLLQRTVGATEAMYLLARAAFEEMGYRRYEWKCNALNAPSRGAALRLGFNFEGVFRQHMIVKGRNRDTAWYAMMDFEWPKVRQAFEEWLKPENLDEQGRQLARLESFRR